jgi:hypothetical protein
MRLTKLLTLVLLVALATPARAATFVVTIKNTSAEYMAPGVFTLSPLLDIGPAPNPGTQKFATYEYARIDCDQPDSYCPAGSSYWCWFANETTLMGRWGLTKGVNAWVPTPPSVLFGLPVFNPGDSATVTITAQPGQKLSYVSKAGDFNNYVDQIVMMHATGNPGDLTVPLFDGAGLPLTAITFDLGGYTVSSSSAVNGTAAQCGNYCPLPNGQTSGCYVALGSTATGPLLPAQPATSQLSTGWSWSAPAGYTTDGIALGDLTSNGGNEIVVEMEGSGVAGNTTGVGRAVVLAASNRTQLSSFDGIVAGNDFMGFPMIENLNGGTYSEYLLSEFGQATPLPGAAMYARSGDSATAIWTSTGYGFPGMWNMGPTAADVRSDNTGNEVIVSDYNGDIVVLKESDGTSLNSYNLYAATGDHIYGHAAVGNVDGKTGNEVVVVGANTGKVYVIGANTGVGKQPMTLLYTSAAPLNGGYAFGSGPAIADLDGDGKAEIIVATGGAGGVYAYSASSGSTACKYKWSTPGGFDYSWSSPVVGDVDGDGKADVVVFSSDSVLSVLKVPTAGAGCTEGTVTWKYTVGNGGPAWFTPALADLIDDTAITSRPALEIVVANYQTLEILHPIVKQPALRYNDASAQFYPTALIESGSAAGPANIYVPGWSNGKVTKLTTPSGFKIPPTPWTTFMGNNTRAGSR